MESSDWRREKYYVAIKKIIDSHCNEVKSQKMISRKMALSAQKNRMRRNLFEKIAKIREDHARLDVKKINKFVPIKTLELKTVDFECKQDEEHYLLPKSRSSFFPKRICFSEPRRGWNYYTGSFNKVFTMHE